MGTDTWVESYSINDGLGIETFYFCIGIKFIEIAYSKGEIGVGE